MSQASSSTTAPGVRYKWYIVGMLWWISFFNYADRQGVYSVFPLLQETMNLTDVELGLLGSAFAWVYGLGSPLAGALVDRVRRKTAILGGLYVWSFICLATGLARNFGQLLFFRAAEGIGETVYYPASMALLSDYHGKRTRSRALGLHQTSVYAGTIGGGYLAGAIGQHYGWRWSFMIFGVLGVGLGLLLQRFVHEPARGAADHLEAGAAAPTQAEPKIPFLEMLVLIASRPTVVALMFAFMCAMFVNMVLLAWMPKYLYDQYHLELGEAALYATMYPQLASMAGAPLGGWLADGLRRRMPSGRIMVQVVAVLAGAPCVFLCGRASTLAEILVVLTAWGLCKGVYDANIFAAVYDVIPAAARGTTAGFMNMMGWLAGGASAPVVIGYLAGRHGMGAAISMASIVYVAAAMFLLLAGLVFLRIDLRRRFTAPAA